jgi:heme/copper-type cytochrome/quinol oxidase subunit 2
LVKMSINSNIYVGDMGIGEGTWWGHMAWPWGFFMGFWAIIFWIVLLVIGFLVYQDAEKGV